MHDFLAARTKNEGHFAAIPLGDVGVDRIAGRVWCEKRHKTERLAATFCHLSGAEHAAIRVRRLADMKMVRKVVWRDE
jgi:hypothetical protein